MRACLLLLAVLAMPFAAAAQEPPTDASAPQAPSPAARYIGKPVVAVRLVMEGQPTTDSTAADLVQARVGQPFSMIAVRESITHLFSLGRFQDIQVSANEVPGGVEVVFDLTPLHGVQKVAYRGNLGVSEGLLRRTISNRFGATPAVGRAPEAARVLEQQFYPDHGYLRASVRAVAVEEHDPDRTVLTFEIDAGPRARIGRVGVDGTVPGNRDRFLRDVGAVTGRPYNPVGLSDALTEFVDDLRKSRRYEASATYRPSVSEDGTVVDLTVMVEAGPIVSLRFEGDPLPKDRLDDLVPVEREASAHEDLIEDSEVRITNYLAQQGYWKASATSASEEGPDRLTIVFTVRRGLQYRIAQSVEIRGNAAIPAAELVPLLERLQAGDIFVSSNLDAAAAAIDGVYRRRGFAQVKVSPAANELNPTPEGVGQVQPVIVITEGPLTLVGNVTFTGNTRLAEERLRGLVSSTRGTPFYAPQVVTDRDAVLLEYLNEGFASADVQVVPTLSEDGTSATVDFRITEGPQTIVDHVLIVGNTRTDPDVIRRELLFRSGEPLGLADLVESRRRLSALGLFRRVQITELTHGGEAAHDVLVTVDESPRTTISYGGGVEGIPSYKEGEGGSAEERYQFAPRGFFDIGRRNVGGKNRSVNLYTRVSLRPGDGNGESDDGFGFIDYRVVGTYREPRPYGLNGELSVTGALEQGVRSTFNFVRKGVTAELLRRFGAGVRGSARYSLATTKRYDERLTESDQAVIDRRFPEVRLSAIGAALSRDTRDDVLEPTRGTFVSVESSLAARSLGGQVGYMKSSAQALWFRAMPGAPSVVLATRAVVGLADGFPRRVPATDEQGNVIPGEEVEIEDLPASERFFAGGDTTVRGFALDGLGSAETISAQGFPRGGNAVFILNGEVRFPIWKTLGAAMFVDGGNVFARVGDFDLGDLRGSAGLGLRYRSPIGPVRVDVGFKMDRRLRGTELEPRREIHFSIGHAF